MIWYFPGQLPYSELPIRPLVKDSELYEMLTKRGREIKELSIGMNHLHYDGHLFLRVCGGVRRLRAHGRCMVDHDSFARYNSNSPIVTTARAHGAFIGNGNNYNQVSYKRKNAIKKVPEDEFCLIWPTVLGFSFRCKTWGEMDPAYLQPIKWDEDAFEKLVRPEKEKSLMQILVKSTFKDAEKKRTQGKLKTFDFISGKGGGTVFLLHGNPGTGKTLTAESIAEDLRQPLYIVSVGELGLHPSALEQNLTKILELGSLWKAIILLDEADVFLEKRTVNDIKRCALVGIFLRTLEYHDGIIFLTTNRVKCFDPAFKSRISMALHYKDLDIDSRLKIWKNFCSKSPEMKNIDLTPLGKHILNGRQIRSCLRIAKGIAIAEKKPVAIEHLHDAANLVQQLDTMVTKTEGKTLNEEKKLVGDTW